MTFARDLIYGTIDRLAHDAATKGLPKYTHVIEAGGDEDRYLRGLLNTVEDDRAHREAKKLRQRTEVSELGVETYAEGLRDLVLGLADLIDPYEKREGQLVRKSDGKPVLI